MTKEDQIPKIKPYEFEILFGYILSLWEITQTYNTIYNILKTISKDISIDIISDFGWKNTAPTREALEKLYELERD